MQVRSIVRVAWLVATLTVSLALSAAANPQNPEHRWGGQVLDPFVRQTANGTFEAWTAEDGGRIRHRNPANGVWSFQPTPTSVKDTLHRIHFLPLGPFEQYGWAVGNNGWVLHTTNGGGTWNVIAQISSPYGPEEIFDVHFLNDLEGWLVGKHSYLKTTDGGNSWLPVAMFIGGLPWGAGFQDEGYTIDIVERPPSARLGLIVTEPGFVFRSTDPALMTWDMVFALPDVLPNPQNYPCIQLTGCELSAVPRFEPWDVEISRHPTSKLALLTGGRGFQCGLMLSSSDDGLTWCKEWHECTCSVPGCNTNCAGDPNYNPPATLYRHQNFATLYGLAINPINNSAIADGYGGQQLLRDPATGVWLDRSVFSALVPTPIGSVKFPYQGAAFAGPNASGQSLAILTGMGGLLRESNNGGQSYAAAVGQNTQGTGPIAAEPHRIKDVYFKDELTGWHVGQHGRIAVTTDGGFTWNDQIPFASAAEPNLNAIAFDPFGLKGVAVGGPTTANGDPKIRYTTNGGTQWREDATFLSGDADTFHNWILREVEWSGTTPGHNFWAVGAAGLILTSSDGGLGWTRYLPAGETDLHLLEFEGVSFMDTTTGLMVGRRPNPSPSGPIRGAAYQYRNVGGVTWTSIALPANVTSLTDVDIAGNVAWAVGEKDAGGVLEGVVLTSTFSSPAFGAFTEVAPPGGFPACTIGEDLLAPILSDVEVSPGGAVWVAGRCGRVWRYVAPTWTEVKSQMDAHVVGMSFVSTGGADAGYIGGVRKAQQCIVKVQ